jgi:hypothetical protein
MILRGPCTPGHSWNRATVTGGGSGIVASVCGTKLYIHTDECADRGPYPPAGRSTSPVCTLE